ncbi:MAG: polynucleotide kinase-phosphatase [Bacteroidota bacterium]
MKTQHIELPEKSLVLLIGASSAGKSTFAAQHFRPSTVISSDQCRIMVADSEQVLTANEATFSVLHLIVEKRLERGLFTVVDATNLDEGGRKTLVDLAYQYHLKPQAIVIHTDLEVLYERNEARSDRNIAQRSLQRQHRRVRQTARHLRKEGFQRIYHLQHTDAEVVLKPMPSNYSHESGPFDIIGDVHGCFDELVALLEKMDYTVLSDTNSNSYGYDVQHPEGRKVVFVGDLVDRGPASNKVLRLAMSMVMNGQALCVPGNHDDKLRRYLQGNKVKIAHGLAETIEQLQTEPEEFREAVKAFLRKLPYHIELDNGRLLVAHAGLQESMHGRVGGAVRSFCLYGQTSGETDDQGLPVRYPWAQDYQGQAMVVYGHTPTENPQWFNRTICLDTGCVFGGKLTALRYPERELVAVDAQATYAASARPMIQGSPAQKDILQAADVLGRQTIETRLQARILIQEGQAAQALETMTRFTADPRQLIYLPPTMSPVKTSKLPDFLEHPAEAFAYYRDRGITEVVCQEKHMGSRAVIVVGQSSTAIEERFGIAKGIGWILTRTGRPFFQDTVLEQSLLERVQQALSDSGFWERHQTNWVLLDAELMPWSAKAGKLLEQQYAATAVAGELALNEVERVLTQTLERGIAVEDLSRQMAQRQEHITRFRQAYRQYCWTVERIEDIRIAPFHLLATEGAVHMDKDHRWHLEELATFCTREEPCLMMTDHRWVDLENEASIAAASAWWLALTEAGGEGMVVKPWEFICRAEGQTLQPALKVRGREYLRIIYGPDYTLPENMARLRKRRVGRKRSLAEREFALGIEAMERFVRREALTKVHQCVFGIMALESEAVDPAL